MDGGEEESPDETTPEDSSEETLTEELPPEPPDCDRFKVKMGAFHDLWVVVRYGSVQVYDR